MTTSWGTIGKPRGRPQQPSASPCPSRGRTRAPPRRRRARRRPRAAPGSRRPRPGGRAGPGRRRRPPSVSRRRARAPAPVVPREPSERRRVGDDLGHPPGLRGQRRRSGEHVPPPVARDPDRDDLDVVALQRVDHRAGGQAADLMLGGPAAEQDHHAASCHRGEPIGWPSRRDRRRGATRPRRSAPPSARR